MREESPSPCEWQQLVDREITRGASQLRVRVDFRSSDGSPANPRLAELAYLAEILKAEADVTRIIEKRNLLAELIRDVTCIFFTRFQTNLAEFGRRFNDAELLAITGRVHHRGATETEEEFRRREFRNAKRYWGEDAVRAMPGFEEERKLAEARENGGRIPIHVLFDDLRTGADARWLELTSPKKLTQLLLIKTQVWRVPKDGEGEGEVLRPVRGVYGAQLARQAARFLASDFQPHEVRLSSPRESRW